MSSMITENHDGPVPNNSPNSVLVDAPPANHLVVHMGGSRNTSPPNSSGASSSGTSYFTSTSSTHGASNMTSDGINRQATAHIGQIANFIGDQPPRNGGSLNEDAELDAEVEMILSNASKKVKRKIAGKVRDQKMNFRERPIQPSYHPSRWPQPSTSALVPPSSVNQQQHSDYRPQYPNHSSYQPCRHPQPHTPLAQPSSFVYQQEGLAYCPNVPQCSTEPSYHPQPATHSSLPQSCGGQYRSHSKLLSLPTIGFTNQLLQSPIFGSGRQWVEDIEQNQRNKVEGRELTKEEKLWNKAVLHTLENKEIYFNRHLAGKPLNWDRYLFPSSLFNPFGEHAKMPQVVTKPPRLINVFKRAQRLVGADKFPSNKDTREKCQKWAQMLKREHNLQIGLGFIVPKQMRAMKKRQVGEEMDNGLEDVESDDGFEPSRKTVKMVGNNSGGKDNNDNNGGDAIN